MSNFQSSSQKCFPANTKLPAGASHWLQDDNCIHDTMAYVCDYYMYNNARGYPPGTRFYDLLNVHKGFDIGKKPFPPPPYKVLITGDRKWRDFHLIYRAIDAVGKDNIEWLLEGDATGADKIAGTRAKAIGIYTIEEPADWANGGRAAGPIRNSTMLKRNPNVFFAFHDNIDISAGTKDMVVKAAAAGVRGVLLYHGGHVII